MARPSKSVLIVGSGGFTGIRLSTALAAAGYQVFGLNREARQAWERAADLDDESSICEVVTEIRPDVVVHLAGIASPAHPDPSVFYSTNAIGTLHLLNALATVHRPRLTIVASSATVYQTPQGEQALDESSPLAPSNHYGVSKLAVEHIARLFADRIPIQVVRPFNYTGPGQETTFLIPKLVDHFARGSSDIEIGNLDLYRDISSVDDTIEAYLRLVRRETAGSVVNICAGEAVHLAALIDELARISGRNVNLHVNPDFVRANEPKWLVGSRARLNAAVGSWQRRSMQSILLEMYTAAKG